MRKLNVTELGRIDIDQFKNSRKLPLTIILDDVRSLYNVGSVFRTSDAFRVERIILCGITATPQNSLVEIHKTALGAEESVDWIYSEDCVSVVKDLNSKGYITVAVEQVEDSVKLDNLVVDKTRRYALVMGNEVKGVHQEVIDASDGCLEIPQFGTKHSMNVSVTAGIVIYHFMLNSIFKLK